MNVKTLLGSLLMAASAFGPAMAQNYPNKPISLIVPYPAGGPSDFVARKLQAEAAAKLSQTLVIENIGGAGGAIGMAKLVHAPADGYTILLSADSVPANPHLMQNLTYDTFKDLVPVSLLARIPLVMLVNSSVPAATVREFVSYAKTGGVKASYGSPGIGTSNHLYFEVFKDLTSIEMPHVAYKGGGPAMTDLMGGHIQTLLISSTLAVPQVGGKVKALAVTSDKRIAQLPNVPTFAEAGFPDFKPQQWTGLFVPAGTPPAIVARIHGEFAKALKAPDVVARLSDLNAEPIMSTPEDFASHLRRENQTLGRLIKARGITAQ